MSRGVNEMKKALGMSGRRRAGNAVYHVFMVLLSLAMIYPFIWSLFSSFKAREQLYTDSPLNMGSPIPLRWTITSAPLRCCLLGNFC